MFHVQCFTVGVTGHRPNRLHVGEDRIAKRIRDSLVAIRSASAEASRRRLAARRPRLKALSPLAEGADRIFAIEALALGFELYALLPFASAQYETTFTDPSTTPAYRSLLARAKGVTELPGSLADADAAYAAVGRETERRCDLLMAIWDGGPAAGPGGTPEIIDSHLARGKPVLWIDACRDRVSLLHWSSDNNLPKPSLERLARRARLATRPDIGNVVAEVVAAKRMQPSAG